MRWRKWIFGCVAALALAACSAQSIANLARVEKLVPMPIEEVFAKFSDSSGSDMSQYLQSDDGFTQVYVMDSNANPELGRTLNDGTFKAFVLTLTIASGKYISTSMNVDDGAVIATSQLDFTPTADGRTHVVFTPTPPSGPRAAELAREHPELLMMASAGIVSVLTELPGEAAASVAGVDLTDDVGLGGNNAVGGAVAVEGAEPANYGGVSSDSDSDSDSASGADVAAAADAAAAAADAYDN